MNGQDGTGEPDDGGLEGTGAAGGAVEAGQEPAAAVVEVVRAMPGAYCDFPYCALSASWSVSLAIDSAPVNRCVLHWPFYRDKLQRDGHHVEIRDH